MKVAIVDVCRITQSYVVAHHDVVVVEEDHRWRDAVTLGVGEDFGDAVLVDLSDGGVGGSKIDADCAVAHFGLSSGVLQGSSIHVPRSP